VETAADGATGLRLARELRPDIITLDVLMPDMDGWAVLSALKSDAELAEIPVVMLTVVDAKPTGFALGVAEYLTKPIDRSRLAAVLRRYAPGGSARTVLIVEDDVAARRVLRRELKQGGWRVLEAANGRIALEQLAQHPPDFVLLDLVMPEMDGFEFLGAAQARWRAADPGRGDHGEGLERRGPAAPERRGGTGGPGAALGRRRCSPRSAAWSPPSLASEKGNR
jgi:CheY-like chemotaxis protein